MANQEGSAQKDDFIVVCRTPDVCKSPVAPTPHQIVGKLDQAILISPIPNGKGLVNFKSKPVFTMASRVATVVGDDAGIGGGVISGVNKGMCRPIRNQATKVNCNGAQVVRHDTEFGMNSAGPDGPPNTFGKLVYQGAMQSAPVPASGTIPPGANSIVAAENPGELGCLGDLSSISGSVGGLGDVVGLAQRAYNLATTDWSNPMAALGAIGGLGGMLGMKSLANTAALAQKAYGLARTDWSNPAAAVQAAMGIAGPVVGAAVKGPGSVMENLTNAAEGLWDDVVDTAGKIWTLPNTALGVTYGGLGHLYGEARNLLGSNKPNPNISIGHNGIQFENNPFIADGAALTLGNAIMYDGLPGDKSKKLHSDVGSHEEAHTHQAQLLGPFYLPAWLLGAGIANAQGQSAHSDANFMECGPYNHDTPWC